MIRLALLVGVFAVLALTTPAIMLGSAWMAGVVVGDFGRFIVWCAALAAGFVGMTFADLLMQERERK